MLSQRAGISWVLYQTMNKENYKHRVANSKSVTHKEKINTRKFKGPIHAYIDNTSEFY